MPVETSRRPVPADFQQQVARWAELRPAVTSVILFGSRARGDNGPDSDWDVAVLFDGHPPSLTGLPRSLENCPVDWVPIERRRAMRQRNVCSVSHAIASTGRSLHGPPLPPPETNAVNLPDAWDSLYEARINLSTAIAGLADYWTRPPEKRKRFESRVAVNGALAGELVCKAALYLRGVEPRRSHSVQDLCGELEREFPSDSLLTLLRRCNGRSSRAHLDSYSNHEREDIATSSRRLVQVLQAYPVVQRVIGEQSAPAEAKPWLEDLALLEDRLQDEMTRLRRSACPPSGLRGIEAGIDPRRTA